MQKILWHSSAFYCTKGADQKLYRTGQSLHDVTRFGRTILKLNNGDTAVAMLGKNAATQHSAALTPGY